MTTLRNNRVYCINSSIGWINFVSLIMGQRFRDGDNVENAEALQLLSSMELKFEIEYVSKAYLIKSH